MIHMASEILLASEYHQYRDPEDGDYINSETELFYQPDTAEFRMDERESYLYGGGTLRRDSTPILKADALDFITDCANDHSSYHGVEMAPDEEMPTTYISDSKEALEIIDNLRHEVESERSNAERKVNTMPEQTQQNQNTQEKAKYANVKMPAAFLTQHEFTAKDGRTFEKAYVHFPEGTKVNGIDLGHYSCDVFLNERMKQQMLSGEQVTIGFKADEPVQVWTGKAGDEQNPYKKYEVKPWDLVKGLKAANEGFKAEKAAEREAAKEQGATLKGESEQMRESSAKLAGDNTPEEHANTR